MAELDFMEVERDCAGWEKVVLNDQERRRLELERLADAKSQAQKLRLSVRVAELNALERFVGRYVSRNLLELKRIEEVRAYIMTA